MFGGRRSAEWLCAAVASALALASCGPGGNSTAYKQAFDKGFNETFDKTTHDSCVASATSHGAAADAAERYCTCVVAELDKLPVDQKEKLTTSSPELPAAAATCRARIQS